MAIATLVAGANGLANFAGDITFKGSFGAVDGRVRLSAQRSRVATIYADRTRLDGNYHLGTRDGTFDLAGNYAADSAALDPSMLAGVTQPLAAAAKTPIGPVPQHWQCRSAHRSQLQFCRPHQGRQFPGRRGGANSRCGHHRAERRSGARLGRERSTYYWPAGGLRIDGNIAMGGGGLPQGRVSLRQPYAGAPMSGEADIAPYAANGQQLSA